MLCGNYYSISFFMLSVIICANLKDGKKCLTFVGKPGYKVTYEVKVISCTSDGADPQYDSGNMKFDVVVKAGEIGVTIDIAAKSVTVN